MTKRNIIKTFERVLLGIFLLITPHLISGCGGTSDANNPYINPCPIYGVFGPLLLSAGWPTPGTITQYNVVRGTVVCRFQLQNLGDIPLVLNKTNFTNSGRTSNSLSYTPNLTQINNTATTHELSVASSDLNFTLRPNTSTQSIAGGSSWFLDLVVVGGTIVIGDSWKCSINSGGITYAQAPVCGTGTGKQDVPINTLVELGMINKN
jgi:hypothetical protein